MLHFHRWFYLFSANISTHQKQPPEVLYENGALENFAEFTGKHLCRSLFYNASCNFIKKDTPAKVFSREFCEIFKNTFTENLWKIVSININSRFLQNMWSEKFRKLTRKHLRQILFLNKKETPTQVYFRKYREILKNTFFVEHLF